MTDTLIGDADGLYHPPLFNDRLLLSLPGTMSEAELHIIRAQLDGGIRNKSARGELRRRLSAGFIRGEADGEVLFHPDDAVCGAIRSVCASKNVVGGRSVYCLNIGGVQLDTEVAEAFLAALPRAGFQAVVVPAEQLEADPDAALAQWRLAVPYPFLYQLVALRPRVRLRLPVANSAKLE